jgi:hypothetical protein
VASATQKSCPSRSSHGFISFLRCYYCTLISARMTWLIRIVAALTYYRYIWRSVKRFPSKSSIFYGRILRLLKRDFSNLQITDSGFGTHRADTDGSILVMCPMLADQGSGSKGFR